MSNVGPVTFSAKPARDQLLRNGRVFTFRSTDRTTGETWASAARNAGKFADVEIERVGEIDPSSELLSLYSDHSGFAGVWEWRDAIAEIHGGGDLPETGILFRVDLIEITDPSEIPGETPIETFDGAAATDGGERR